MNPARRVFVTAPVTSVYALSTAAFWIIMSVVPGDGPRLVLFYLFALPSYLVSLAAMILGNAYGWEPSRLLALGLCVAVDLGVVLPMRMLSRRTRAALARGDGRPGPPASAPGQREGGDDPR